MMEQRRNITKAYFDFARCQYAPLINKLAFDIGVSGSHSEELRNRGLQELIRCMVCYNGRSSFMTFFYGRLRDVFRHMRDSERRVEKIPTLDSSYIANMVGSSHDIDAGMMAQECIEYLDDDERDVITKFFFHNKTTKEISNDLGLVIPTVCRIKRMAIRKMRNRYGV